MKSLRSAGLALLVAFGLSACSAVEIHQTIDEKGGDVVDHAFAVLAEFNELDAVALEYAQKPDTPTAVVKVLVQLREPAAKGVPLIAEAAGAYRVFKNRLLDTDNPSTFDQVAAALAVLTERMDRYEPAIRGFLDYVKRIQGLSAAAPPVEDPGPALAYLAA